MGTRRSPAGKFAVRIVIGAAMLVGAPALAWYSSIAMLQFDKAPPRGANVELSRKLFGLVQVSNMRVANVVSVTMVRSREPGSQSDTPDRLEFNTLSGPVDLGYEQQRFTRYYTNLRDFLGDDSQSRLALSSAGNWDEKLRFAFAQFMAVVFLLGGGYVVKEALWRRRQAGAA
jgi:hypothetical protein